MILRRGLRARRSVLQRRCLSFLGAPDWQCVFAEAFPPVSPAGGPVAARTGGQLVELESVGGIAALSDNLW